VAAAVMLYAFSSGLMGRLQGSSNEQLYVQRLAVEYYDWTTLSTLRLTVRNVGQSQLTLVDFFIAGRKNTTALTFGSGCNSPNGMLPVQASCVITFPMPGGFTPSSGFAYNAKLVTKEGTVFSFSCIAGQNGVP